jgi:hypothetical protein
MVSTMLTFEENIELLYPKILTAFVRDERYKFVQNADNQIMGGYQWCKPEFDEIKTFEVTQKIDGTNTRLDIRRELTLSLKRCSQ